MLTGGAAEVIVALGGGCRFVWEDVIFAEESFNLGQIVYWGIGACYLVMNCLYELVGLFKTVGGGCCRGHC